MRDDTRKQIEDRVEVLRKYWAEQDRDPFEDGGETYLGELAFEAEALSRDAGGNNAAFAFKDLHIVAGMAAFIMDYAKAEEAKYKRLDELVDKAGKAREQWRLAGTSRYVRLREGPPEESPVYEVPSTYLDYMDPTDRAEWLAFLDEARAKGAVT